MKRYGLFGLWLGVAALTTGAVWQVVDLVDDTVSPRPAAPVVVLTTPTTQTIPTTTSSTALPTTTVTTSTTVPPSTVSTAPSTRPPTTPSSTTTAPDQGDRVSVPTPGGTVVVEHSGDTVSLVSVSPALGYAAEIDDAGPGEVRVEFRLGDQEIEVRIKSEDGELVTEIETDG